MAKVGRPKKELDRDQFEKLCALQCTKSEIAGFFLCSEDTVDRWVRETYEDEKSGKPMNYQEAFKIYSAGGKMSLRRTQFRLAERSAAMAIFLGKNYLGQRDSFPEELAGEGMIDKLIGGLMAAGAKGGGSAVHGEAAGDDEAVAGGAPEEDQPA